MLHTPNNAWKTHSREGRLVRWRARGEQSRMLSTGCVWKGEELAPLSAPLKPADLERGLAMALMLCHQDLDDWLTGMAFSLSPQKLAA